MVYIDPFYNAEYIRSLADSLQNNTEEGALMCVLRDIRREAELGKYILVASVENHFDSVVSSLLSIGYKCTVYDPLVIISW